MSAELRRQVAGAVRRVLGEPGGGLDAYGDPPGDPGLFGPGSIAWQVHSDLPSMLVGGISSLMLQALHPLAMAGVAQHSRYREDPLGRLQRTAAFVAGTTFGGRELAMGLIEQVRRVHLHVRGVARDGRPYRAEDPELLTWVHCAEVWSFLRSYQRYGPRPLLREEKDRYLAEVAQIARLLGADGVPESVDDVRAYLRRTRGSLEVTPEALEAVAFLRRPLGPAGSGALGHRVVVEAAEDLLPEVARRALGARPATPIGRVRARLAMASLSGLIRWSVGPSVVLQAASARARARPESPPLTGRARHAAWRPGRRRDAPAPPGTRSRASAR